MIEIYTDGSFSSKSLVGGFGVVVIKNNEIIHTYKENFHKNTTHNRMELQAILYALGLIQTTYKDEKCIIYSDSSYCVKSCNEWIDTWAKNGWKRNGNKDIENLDLIQSLYKYITIDFFNCQVKIEKVLGHSGNIYNELADALATNNINKFNKIIRYHNIKKI